MARITGLVGDVRGKVGNMVGYTRRGANFLREYQPNVTNPNTLRQQYSRQVFTIAQQLSRELSAGVLMGYSAVKPTYERQAFVGRMVENKVVSINLGEIAINYASIPISRGPLDPPRGGSPSATIAGRIGVTIDSSSITDNNVLIDGITPINCLVFCCVYNADLKTSVLGIIGYRPAVGEYVQVEQGTVSIPQGWSGDRLHIWIFCKQSPTPKNGIPLLEIPPRIRYNASDAVYCGTVEAA